MTFFQTGVKFEQNTLIQNRVSCSSLLKAVHDFIPNALWVFVCTVQYLVL